MCIRDRSVYVLTAKDDASSSSTTAYNDLTASQLMANDIATLAKSETVQKRKMCIRDSACGDRAS